MSANIPAMAGSVQMMAIGTHIVMAGHKSESIGNRQSLESRMKRIHKRKHKTNLIRGCVGMKVKVLWILSQKYSKRGLYWRWNLQTRNMVIKLCEKLVEQRNLNSRFKL